MEYQTIVMEVKEEPQDEELVDPDKLFESVWFEAESETVVVTPDQSNVHTPQGDNAKSSASNPLETKKKPSLKTRSCPQCDFKTVHGNSLKYHMLTHTDERPYSCEYCDFTSKYPPILKRHMNTLHADLVMSNVEPELLTCTKCDYKTTIKQNLKGHIRKHKKDKQFKCSQCSYETSYRHSYVKHQKIHKSEEYRCDKCPFVTRFYGHITRHMEQIHNEVMQESKHVCEFCQTTSKEKWKLRRHKERSIMQQARKCVICDFETIYKCQMRKHKNSHVDQDGDCTFVLAAAIAATTDATNKNVENDIENEPDSQAEKETVKEVQDYIQNQQKKQTNTENSTTYKCDQCYFITSFQGHMVRHLQNIHNEVIKTTHVCEFCTTPSVDAAKLKQHKERSHVKGGLQCNQCEFRTSYKCELKRHNILEHTTNGKKDEHGAESAAAVPKPKKPETNTQPRSVDSRAAFTFNEGVLSCSKCPFKTLYEADMCKHLMEVHNMCRYCRHCFGDRWAVNAHILKSKTDTIVKCSYCDFGSYFKCETRTHMDTHFTYLGEPPKETPNFDIRSLLTYPYDGNMMKQSHYQRTTAENTVTLKEAPQYGTVNSEPSSSQSSYLDDQSGTMGPQMGQSKFGKFLIDQNCVDWRSIQVIESNDSVNRYKCPLCEFPSKFKACVQRHFQRHHTGEQNRPYKCVNCNFSTKTKDAIALHNKRNPPGDNVSCKLCDFTTQYKCAFVLHQKQHYRQKCSICSAIYKHRHELVKHIATKHLGKGLKCFYCDYVSLRKDSMDSHILLHTGEKPFRCTLCPFGTVRKSLLDTHMRERHKIFKQDLEVTYITKSKIESLKVPSAEPPPEDTNKPTEEETNIASDKNAIAGVNVQDPIFSPDAQPETILASEYGESVDMLQDYDNDYFDDDEDVKPDIQHFVEVKPSCSTHEPTEFFPIQTHDTDNNTDNEEESLKLFACDHCDYTSPSKSKLAAHVRRTHDSNKHYKCILCSFTTSQKKRLNKHREMHKKTASFYKCNLCSYKTKLKRYILKHLSTIHNKMVKTKHVCVYCNASTVSKVMLAAHRRRNRLPKSVQCAMCKFETVYKCQIKKHRRSHLCETKDEKDETLTDPKAATMYTKEKVTEKSDDEQDSDESGNDSASADDGTFKCEKCQFKTLSEKKMSKHFIEVHNGCKYCSHDFQTREEHDVHIQNSKNEDVVKCFFCDFDSDYKCETCKHICSHFTGVYGLEEDGGANLEKKVYAVLESLKTENVHNEGDKNEETEDATENNSHLQLRHNKFGNYLIDPNHVDARTLQIKRASINDPYQCPACDFTTKYNCSIQRHIQRNHANNRHRPYKCVDCNFATKSKDSIRLHNERKLSRKTLFCKRCKFTAKVKCALALHQRVHYNMKCMLCPQKFSYKRGLISHFATTHLKIGLKCQFCDFIASAKIALAEHESSHTGIKPFQCSVCEYSSSRERYLEIHFRKHHSFYKKMKSMKKEVTVKIEKMSQDNGTVFVCDICGFSEVDKARLSAHIKRKHTLMFMCEKCPYTTPYKGALKTHSLTHQNYSIFKCKICPYETAFKGRVISHLKKIHNDKTLDKDAKLICELCGEKQRSVYLLKMHHENGKYDEVAKCKLCGFEALYKCHMEKHEKTHFAGDDDNKPEPCEEKMYTEERVTSDVLKCRFCNYIASKRSGITKHEATHIAENPFRCNMCGHSAKTKILLMVHWKKHHKPLERE